MPPPPLPPSLPLSLEGERVAFTGTLASMTHRQAVAIVLQHGGTAGEHVSRKLTMLVIGEEGWPLEADGQPSVKWQQVTRWRQEGLAIRIVTESDWLGFVGLQEQQQEVHRRYTPAMLSQLLNVPVNVIRGWERSGLIKPVSQVYRLSYFDFQEVASARRLAELVSAGISCREIQTSLARLQGTVAGIEKPLAQLQILARDRTLIYRDPAGRLRTPTGQRLFDFEADGDHPSPTPPESAASAAGSGHSGPGSAAGASDAPTDAAANTLALHAFTPPASRQPDGDDWFEQGCLLVEDGQLTGAVEAFRLSLMDEPDRAEAHFHLAETLYRLDNLHGALERYHASVELDHNYLEAWTQLGCVYAQLSQLEAALEAFDVALDVHPDYPDAHIHKAEVLHQLGRTGDAIAHWTQYLQFDQRGPWAAGARKRLEEAGVLSRTNDDSRELAGDPEETAP